MSCASRHILCAAVAVVSLMAMQASAQIIQLDPPTDSEPAPEEDTTAPRIDLDLPSLGLSGRHGSVLSLDPERADTGTRAELLPLRMERLSGRHNAVARLTGESAQERFILFLPDTPGATELELALRSGIDTLPDRSSLRVAVNGVDLGQTRPASFDEFATARFDVPEGVLRPGPNLVEVSARHTHRIACGADASFALWTEIDLRRSGVTMASDRFALGPEGFIAAIAAQTARGAPVTFHRPDPEESMVDVAPFIARAAIALGGTPPEIVSAPYWRAEGEVAQLARVTAFPPGEGPEMPRFRRGGDGSIVLLLDQSHDYDDVLGTLFPSASVMPNRGPAMLRPGAPRALSDLGVSRLQGQGRYQQLTVDFALPWDWMLLASQRARLDLDYRFAADLPEGALLLVKINGTTVRLLPLDRDGGQALPTLPITFAARLLHPGINRLEFEALIPGDPPDMACPPLDGAILEVSAGSRLFVPDAPDMVQPSIDRALASVAPRNVALSDRAAEQLPPGLVPQIAAALLVAPEETRLIDTAARLRVGILSDLDEMQTQLPRTAVRALFQAMGLGAFRSDAAPSEATPWETVSGSRGVLGRLGLTELAALPGRARDTLVGLVRGETPPLEEWLADKDAQIALLQPDMQHPEDVWMILSPSIDPTLAATALAASRVSHDGPRGQVAVYSEGRGWASWTAPDRPLTLRDTLSPGNFRAVMGNYATTAPLPFIGTILGLTLLSAAVALAVLLLTRRRSR